MRNVSKFSHKPGKRQTTEVTRARAEIQREKDEAISELRGVVAELAIDAASKIISAELNAERHQHIIDASIGRLPVE